MTDQQFSDESLSFIFDYTKDAPDLATEDATTLDNKVVQVFSAASVIIGLGGLSGSSGHLTSAILLALGLAAYVGVGIVSFIHLRGRTFRRSRQADTLWDNFWQHSVSDIKHSLVQDIAAAYLHNKRVVEDKGKTLNWALAVIAVEVFFVGSSAVSRLAGL